MSSDHERPPPEAGAAPAESEAPGAREQPATTDTQAVTHTSSHARPADVRELLERVAQPQPTRLRAESELAAGGMGYIETVADNSLLRRLAMKVIHNHLQEDARAVGMFIREAQVTGQLDHPNIVPVHEIGVDPDGRLYFTMKLVEGRTLATLIEKLPAGPIEHGALMDLVDLLVKVCDALAFAHSRGVIHSDVKPENVMVGDFGEVYLMDWGLSRILGGGSARASVEDQVRKGEFLGTPAYMSPEQANCENDNFDARTDVFGVGATLYEIITRRPPFAGESSWECIAAAQECAYRPMMTPGEYPPVPRTLLRIAERAMAKDPAERFPGADHLKKALVHFMHGGGEFPMIRLLGGAHVVREGEPGDTAYIIVSGRCEVYKAKEGRRVTLRTMGPGDVFGETSILSPGPRTASVVALDDVKLHMITRDVFEGEIESMKPWMGAFIRALAMRFREREAAGPAATLRARPALIAEHLLMRLLTWGRIADDGALEACWSHLRTVLAEAFGQEPEEIESVVREFREIEILADEDRVRVANTDALKRAVRAQLHREASD